MKKELLISIGAVIVIIALFTACNTGGTVPTTTQDTTTTTTLVECEVGTNCDTSCCGTQCQPAGEQFSCCSTTVYKPAFACCDPAKGITICPTGQSCQCPGGVLDSYGGCVSGDMACAALG